MPERRRVSLRQGWVDRRSDSETSLSGRSSLRCLRRRRCCRRGGGVDVIPPPAHASSQSKKKEKCPHGRWIFNRSREAAPPQRGALPSSGRRCPAVTRLIHHGASSLIEDALTRIGNPFGPSLPHHKCQVDQWNPTPCPHWIGPRQRRRNVPANDPRNSVIHLRFISSLLLLLLFLLLLLLLVLPCIESGEREREKKREKERERGAKSGPSTHLSPDTAREIWRQTRARRRDSKAE